MLSAVGDEEAERSTRPESNTGDDDGTDLPAGTYEVDDEGNVRPVVNMQTVVERIPWERLDELLNNMGKRTSAERVVNLVGGYVLVAGILAIAAILAWEGIIEGQALVGFLGAAIGYLLAKGRTGMFGGQQ